MKRAFVHFGLSKTGTTAVQASLSSSRETLRDNGLLYPGRELDHVALLPAFHQAGAAHFRFRNANIPEEVALQQSADFLEQLEREARGFSGDLLLSTEYLQTLNANAWKKLCGHLEGLGFEPHAICYVRHPVAHATSAIQHEVKMGSKLLEDLLDNPRWPEIRLRLRHSLDVLPRDRVHVRRFEDARQDGLEIDILKTAGYSGPLDEVPRSRVNSSLSMAGVLLADARNRLQAKGEKADNIQKHLASIGGPKFTLPPRTVRKVLDRSGADLEWLKQTFGIGYEDIDVNIDGHDRLSPEAAEDIVKLLSRIGRRAKRSKRN